MGPTPRRVFTSRFVAVPTQSFFIADTVEPFLRLLVDDWCVLREHRFGVRANWNYSLRRFQRYLLQPVGGYPYGSIGRSASIPSEVYSEGYVSAYSRTAQMIAVHRLVGFSKSTGARRIVSPSASSRFIIARSFTQSTSGMRVKCHSRIIS